MNAEIELKSIHFAENDKTEDMEKATGEYHIKGNTRYIMYDILPEDSTNPVHVRIKICKDEFSITRRGEVNSQMSFVPRKCTRTNYVTPYGTFLMEFDTKEYTVEDNDNALKVVLKYDLSIDGMHQSRCHIFLRLNINNDTMSIV